jgi:hypothetical protein
MNYKKRGMAHLEMAISFGLFALFTFWLILYLNPIRNQNISNVLIDSIQRNVLENTSISVIEIPVSVNAPSSCFRLQNPFDTDERTNIFVEDEGGSPLDFAILPGKIEIENQGSFYRLYYAEVNFDSIALSSTCPDLNATQFSYMSTRMISPLYIVRIEDLYNRYYSDYPDLKEQFNYPANSDFALNITNLLTKQSLFDMKMSKPSRVEVIAREIPIEIMQRDGSMIKAIMSLQVW